MTYLEMQRISAHIWLLASLMPLVTGVGRGSGGEKARNAGF